MQPYKRAREQGDASGSNRLYKLLVKPEWRGTVWKPRWNKELRTETHFRPTGPMTEDRKGFLPWRLSGEESNFGPWLGALPIITFGTAAKNTVVVAFEDPDRPGEMLDTDVHPTPITQFIANARTIANNDPRIEHALFKGGPGRSAAIPRLGAVGLMQGVLLQSGTNNYYQAPKFPALMMLSSSACSALEDTLNAEVEGYAGDPENWDTRFQCGDILNPDAGRILSFYTDGAPTAATGAGAAQAVDWNKGAAGNKKADKSKEFAGYACEVVGATAGAPITFPLPRREDGTLGIGDKSFFTPWRDVVRFLGAEEMIEVLVKSFEDHPEILLAALKPYHDQLPNYIKENATVIVSAPAPQEQLPGLGPQQPAPQGAWPTQPQPQAPAQPQTTPQTTPAPIPPTETTQTPAQPQGGVDWSGGGTPTPAETGDTGAFMGDGTMSPDAMGAFSGGQPAAQQPVAPSAAPGANQNDAMQGALDRLNSLRNGQG
jgi:hypothetical protein